MISHFVLPQRFLSYCWIFLPWLNIKEAWHIPWNGREEDFFFFSKAVSLQIKHLTHQSVTVATTTYATILWQCHISSCLVFMMTVSCSSLACTLIPHLLTGNHRLLAYFRSPRVAFSSHSWMCPHIFTAVFLKAIVCDGYILPWLKCRHWKQIY